MTKEKLPPQAQKVLWIDIAKVLGIYLMIIGHKGLVDEQCTKFIFSFHMPMFFILSGMLYHPVRVIQTIIKVYRTLLLPFVIMTCIWLIYDLMLIVKNKIAISALIPYIIGSFISPGNSYMSFHPICEYLWFLVALAEIKVLLSFSNNILKMVCISCMCLLLNLVFNHFNIHLPFALNSAFLAMPFFVIGYIGSKFLIYSYSKIINYGCFLFCTIVTGMLSLYNERVDINNNIFGNDMILYLLCGLIGTIGLFSLSKILSYNINHYILSIVRTLSSGTLLIIGFSAFITSIYQDLAQDFNWISYSFRGLLIGFSVLMTFIPITLCVKKIFPALLGFR